MSDHEALVLVVEDEPQMRKFIRASLTSHGYRVLEAEKATEAMAVLMLLVSCVLLTIFAERKIPVDEAARREILGCTDLDALDRWIRRALTASSLTDVLAQP